MLFRTIYDDKLAQAAYLIGCQKTGEALIIDPERDVDRYIAIARREGLRITAISETHIHADFLSGARELAERTGATLYLSGEGGEDWQYGWLDRKAGGGIYRHQILKDGDIFMVGKIRIQAVHTPGHTPEHMSYMVTDLGGGATEPMGIATGDFVFVGDVGRPDLLESAAGNIGAKEPSARTLYHSLRSFTSLPDYLQVWPGHGAGSACGKELGAIPQSTVGYEKRFNHAIRDSDGDEDTFVESILAGQPEPPMYFARMKKENRDGPALLGHIPSPRRLKPEELEEVIHDDAIVVVDTRRKEAFGSGFIPGALNAPLNRTFPTITGSYIEPERKIVLVVDADRTHEAVVDLIRIGLDRIEAFITPSDLEVYFDNGGEREIRIDVTADELAELRHQGEIYILDTRRESEYDEGHISGAVNIAHTRLPAHLDELPRDRDIYIYCRSGSRSAAATSYLRSRGYGAINVTGGYNDIRATDLEIESAGIAG